ncbi:MAG: sigma-54 dependent transcriptional regulator, partial [Vicinamibacterales bacterium]
DDGLKCLNVTMELASQAGENALLNTAALLAFETKTIIAPTTPVGTLPFPGPGASSGLSALAERVLATSLAQTGQPGRGRRHYERAARVHRALGNVPAQIELDRSWANTAAATADRHEDIEGDGGSATVMHSIAALLNHSGQPEILATEVIAILNHVGCTTGAVAVAREESGRETVLAAVGSPVAGPGIRAFTIGTARQRTIELRLQPLPDLEAQATVNSLALLLSTVGELEVARAEREQRLTLWPIDHLPSLDDSVILGEMATLMASARRIAAANVVVLITGESGTGKEVLARAIHGYSSRARKPFIPFNCTTIARELAESQLFGHRRGAFTGADRDAPGLVRSAKDGTLFLDEIGEMALELQPKLLRFLESGEISPLGDSSPFTVDVRIIAATNANLEALVEQGRFREDLYYRVNVVRLTIPPLRDRRDEIPSLVHHFVAKACGEFNKSGVRVAEETMEQLILYPWPGNVRQLQNELRRIVALADNDAVLTPVTLSRAIRQETASGPGRVAPGVEVSVPFSDKLAPTISRIERDMIKAALTASNGKLEAAAKALGISRKGLYLKRQRLGV